MQALPLKTWRQGRDTLGSNDQRRETPPKPRKWPLQRQSQVTFRPVVPEADLARILDAEMTLETKRRLRLELAWLKDPGKLGQSVDRLLARGNLQKALNLVRLASTHDHKPVVAWNKLVSYIARQRDHKSAFRLYNEMKKRAQFPDSYTVTHLLKGLALRPVGPEQVRLALHLHESLEAKNSKVSRDIIHTNAAMQVCANAIDLDSMWTLVSRIPDHGRAAADRVTFDTILTALRRSIDVKPRTNADYEETLARVLDDGRRIWQDIYKRWKKGTLRLDEGVICNYARLLLLSTSPETSAEIFRIAEDTMGIPTVETARSTTAAQTTMTHHVIPGSNFLSVILDMYGNHASSIATSVGTWRYYWEVLVNSHGVEPDRDNYRSALRLNARSGDSASSVSIIEQITADEERPGQHMRHVGEVAHKVTHVDYDLALASCSKGAAASHDLPSFEHAIRILDLFASRSSQLPPRTLSKFVHCAVASHHTENVLLAINKVMPFMSSCVEETTIKGSRTNASDTRDPYLTSTMSYILDVANSLLSNWGRKEITSIKNEGAAQELVQLKSHQRLLDSWLRDTKRSDLDVPSDSNALRSLRGFRYALHAKHTAADASGQGALEREK